jgi:hypothetical protein
MEIKNQKETQYDKKPSNEINNKNKFNNFFNKKRASSETKESQDSSNLSPNSNTSNKFYQNNTNYLNSLLKKSFFNTINNNSSLITSPSKQKKENNNSLIYPNNVPKNFIPQFLFESINLDSNKKTTRQLKNELRNVLDLYEKQKNEMKKYEKDIEDIKLDLKKAKEAKNNIMEEVFHIKKEIELMNESESTNSTTNLSKRLTMQTGNIKNLLKNYGIYIVKLTASNYKLFFECYLQLEKHFVSIFNIPSEGGLASIFFCFKDKIEVKDYQEKFKKNREIIEKNNVVDYSLVKSFANGILVKLEDMPEQRKKMEENAKRL